MPNENEKPLTVYLRPDTAQWLAHRALINGRAKLREAASIIEAERAREARAMSGGVLHAQGKKNH